MEGVAFLSDFIMPDILVWFPFIKHWLLLQAFQHLLGYCFHAFFRRVAALFVDVVKVKALNAIMPADGVHGLVDALLQLAVQHEEQPRLWVMLPEVCQ